jgi:pimeloyl-ACP methyl ester carboxylesterase
MTHTARTNAAIAGPDGRAQPSSAQPVFPPLSGVEHRFVDLPGLRMHVAEAGRGEPVLLLHGFPQHWWEWRKVIPGLAEHYRVICPDLRGAGWTDAPPTGYTRHQLLADVVALLDACELDRVRLVAHDWAAAVGFQLCLSHPDRVHKFLALSVPPPSVAFHPAWFAVLPSVWFDFLIAAPVLGPLTLGKGKQRLPRHLLRKFTSHPGVLSPEDTEIFVAQLRQPGRARAGSALYRRFIIPEIQRIIGGAYRDPQLRLTTPTRILIGTDDPIARPELFGGYEEYVDDLEFEFADGSAHFIVDEKPDIVMERALEFFAQS